MQEVAPTTHLVMAWAEGYESLTERVHVALDFPLAPLPPDSLHVGPRAFVARPGMPVEAREPAGNGG